MQRLTDVVKNLLILNLLMFLAQYLFGERIDFLMLRYPGSENFLPVQLVTHFFMHGGLMHIFFNMFALVMFGPPLEVQWGPKRFLAFYLICAFGAVGLHMLYNWWDFNQMQAAIEQFQAVPSYEAFQDYFSGINLSNLMMESGQTAAEYVSNMELELSRSNPRPETVSLAADFMQDYRELKMNIPVVGASGAIYGLLLAFGMYYPNVELMLIFLPIPIKAKYFIPVLMLIELFLGFNQFSWDNIAHFAHLGGALTGFLLILYWRKFDNPYRRQ